LQVGLALANLGFGFLADRFGHRRGLEWGLVLNVVSLVLAWLSGAAWAFALFCSPSPAGSSTASECTPTPSFESCPS